INRVFEDLSTRAGNESALSTWSPAVDIYETEHELVVKADLPDVDEKDLDVRVENNILTIHGERKFEKKVNEDNYLRVERAYGSFTRSFTLPQTVSAENATAEYKNGVLRVVLQKREEVKARRIEVGGEGTQAAPKTIEAKAESASANKGKTATAK
ncbi:MAG TPA: Hsp20/alpha crystallin family protein, partial [Pyrinomonadaceae bacterium]|nr:Hsp20/alpha crystallin family protein [Pyrinomonadaceae bacterium]